MMVGCGDGQYLDEVHRQALDESDYRRMVQRWKDSPDPAIRPGG